MIRRAALATLTAFLLITATAHGAPALKSDERKDQQAAVELVERLGGRVLYHYQRPDPARPDRFDKGARPPAPGQFYRVVYVNLRDTRVADDDLEVIGRLAGLENLDLTSTRVSGKGLAHLAGLKGLRVLMLWKTRVGDAGLAHLAGMTKLWALYLDDAPVSDTGMVHLKGLTGLEECLGLSGTGVSDGGLAHLAGLARLRTLNVRKTAVTEAGVKGLRAALKHTDIPFGE